jgi:hypothetical protein
LVLPPRREYNHKDGRAAHYFVGACMQRSVDAGNREIFLFRFEAPNCL